MIKILKVLLPIIVATVAYAQADLATKQIIYYKNSTKGPIGTITTDGGAPVEYKDATNSLNSNFLDNEHLVDGLLHFVHERIPERVVHASGTGAFGYFEITHDISNICKAKFFSKIGKKTPIAVRFSTGFSRSGARDTVLETRGFAVKFYTEEGNFDLLTLNTPVFSVRDPLLFTILHITKGNPATNFLDPNLTWDYLTLRPESIFLALYIFSDYGMPISYNHLPGYSVHTYQLHNKDGDSTFVRFHFSPDEGIKNLNATEAIKVAGGDPNYYARGLYNKIANGEYPSWQLKVQILSLQDIKDADFDVFDVTKVLPEDKYPLHTVGKITLNRNPINHFNEIEQLAFTPGNLVPGIIGSPDKLFEARRFAYREAQIHRLGVNYRKIPVNCPMHFPALTYNRDGVSPINDNGGGSPNYYPNSFNGPTPYVDKKRPTLLKIYEKNTDNFDQAGNFYSNVLNSEGRNILIQNIISSLCLCEEFLKTRAVKYFTAIHSDFGKKITEALAKCA